MKLKKLNIPYQVLVLVLAAFVMGFMLQMAHAQSPSNQGFMGQGQVLQTNMPQKTWGSRLMQNTSLNYYTQFLGPTVGGPAGQTYNVFQESTTPYQSFHSANIRYQFNQDWAMGVSLSGVNAYGETTTSQRNDPFKGSKGSMHRDEFFNARAFITLPSLVTTPGILTTNIAYEAPTSVLARRNDMQLGYVLAQQFALTLPSVKWTAGVSWMYYRVNFKSSVLPPSFQGGSTFALQTTIFNAGPYLAYRINDKWGMTSSMTFDWDQRGKQAGTGSWNNNLPDRARAGISYYPTKFKQIANVGLFTQGLLKYTKESQAIGAEMAARF